MKIYFDKNLLITGYIRILLTILILYYIRIPIFIKILLIIFTDLIDCNRFHKYIFSKWISCKSILYQKFDKIIDTICYTILLIYIINKGNLKIEYNYLLILLFIYRLIGIYYFLINNNEKYLFYFPNFFLEICLGIVAINYFPRLNNYVFFIFIFIILYKIIQEYYLHFK